MLAPKTSGPFYRQFDPYLRSLEVSAPIFIKGTVYPGTMPMLRSMLIMDRGRASFEAKHNVRQGGAQAMISLHHVSDERGDLWFDERWDA